MDKVTVFLKEPSRFDKSKEAHFEGDKVDIYFGDTITTVSVANKKEVTKKFLFWKWTNKEFEIERLYSPPIYDLERIFKKDNIEEVIKRNEL